MSDNTDSGTPRLEVIEGGRSNTNKEKRRAKGKPDAPQEEKIRTGNKATPSGLTAKQEAFAIGLSEGLTNAEAYRRAYDTSAMKAGTVHNEASRMAQHPGVTARLNELLTQRKVKHGMLSEKQSDRVWRNVWRLAEGVEVPPAVQQSAIALAAKMAGMLTDKVEIENKSADSKSIEAELLERLQRLSA